jgi:hypothetical protein
MICRPCQRAADYAIVLGAEWATSKHRQCRGETWCDCQHRIPADIPQSMATVGTPENGRLVSIAAGIELEDLEYRTAAAHQAKLAEETS